MPKHIKPDHIKNERQIHMGYFIQGLTMGLAYVAPIGLQNLFVINSALTHPRRRAL